MKSIDLLRNNLIQSEKRVLMRIEDMRDHSNIFPTPNGGCHTLWVLGHLAFIEGLVIQYFMLGKQNPLADWEDTFDGKEVSGVLAEFPPFNQVLTTCRNMRTKTRELLDTLAEKDLDTISAKTPAGYEDSFGTYRLCFQYVADHWYMHRGQLADARRAAGVDRMWV